MDGFYITIKNGLLDPKHIQAMHGDKNSGAIWLFLWFLDKMTIIDGEKGEGKVLGGKPVKFEDVEETIKMSRRTYQTWLNILREGNYITTVQTPYGLSVTVHKAFKVFGQKTDVKTTAHLAQMDEQEVIRDPAHLSQARPFTSNIRQYSKDNKENIKEILSFWNEVFNTRYSSTDPLEENVTYWMTQYTMEEIKTAIKKILDSDYWSDKMTPVIFFRRMNPRREKVDYIGETLNLKKKNGLSDGYRIIKA